MVVGSGKRLNIDRATGGTNQNHNHFLNIANRFHSTDDISGGDFARPDHSESLNSIARVDENVPAIPDAPAHSDDAYEDHCSFFITLPDNASRNHCNNLQYVLRKKCEKVVAFVENFQSFETILEHTIKETSKIFANLGSEKTVVTSTDGLDYGLFVRNVQSVLKSQVTRTN